MPLSADVLGILLYEKAAAFNDREISDIESARRAFWNDIAEVIIQHLQTHGMVDVPALGLVAPTGGGPVTGKASGKIL